MSKFVESNDWLEMKDVDGPVTSFEHLYSLRDDVEGLMMPMPLYCFYWKGHSLMSECYIHKTLPMLPNLY